MTAIVQGPTNVTSGFISGTTYALNLALTNPVTVGNAVVFAFFTYLGQVITITSIVDNKGNTYTFDSYYSNATTSYSIGICGAHVSVSGVQTITVNISTATAMDDNVLGEIYEVSGLATSSPLDAAPGWVSTGYGTGPASYPFTNTGTNDFGLIFFVPQGGTECTQQNGWTLDYDGIAEDEEQMSIAHNILASSGSNSCEISWTGSQAIFWWGATYKGAPPATYTGINQLDYSLAAGSGANSITTTGAAGGRT